MHKHVIKQQVNGNVHIGCITV